MGFFSLTKKQTLFTCIALSALYFVAGIVVALKTKSLALLADAFHYMNDFIGYIVALSAIVVSERRIDRHHFLSFGWQRAETLGAFFNSAFLVALGFSILLSSIQRFISVERMEDPRLVVIMGSVGFIINIINMSVLHGHDLLPLHEDHCHSHNHSHDHGNGHAHNEGSLTLPLAGPSRVSKELPSGASSPVAPSAQLHEGHNHVDLVLKPHGKDLGILGAQLHVMGDTLNNIAVIISGLIVWLLKSDARFYADPALGVVISFIIGASVLGLLKQSGAILLQSTPDGVKPMDVKHDLERIPGVESIHELHIWRLDQRKTVASVHVIFENGNESIPDFMERARIISECLHAYGIHSSCIQPEVVTPRQIASAPTLEAASETETPGSVPPGGLPLDSSADSSTLSDHNSSCGLLCQPHCESLRCCSDEV